MEHLGFKRRGSYDFLEGWVPNTSKTSWHAIYFVIDEEAALHTWGQDGMSPECQKLTAWMKSPELYRVSGDNLFIKAF